MNDESIDNSLAFKKAIDYLSDNNGGTILLKGGIYKFKKNVEINKPLSGITIKGVGMFTNYPSVVGTLINYTGSGYWLDITQGTQF